MPAEPLLQGLLIALGLALLAFTVVDLLWTTLWSGGGAGPLTGRVAGTLWGLVRHVAPSTDRGHRLRSAAGPVILMAVAALWVLLLYAGWALIFASTEAGIVTAGTKDPASLADRLYFAGYNLFTLGNGDLQPATWPWQLATVAAAANGLLLITLAVTYLVPVVSAATTKRAVSGQITSLGADAGTFVTTMWGQQGFSAVATHLASITSTLGTIADQHLAYPILHYFHGRPATRSSALAVAVLDEALTILRFGVAEQARPEPAVLAPARETVASYLDTLAAGFIPEAGAAPPPPPLEPLRRAGIPTVDDAAFAQAVHGLAQRRRLLLGLLEAEGWSWKDVTR